MIDVISIIMQSVFQNVRSIWVGILTKGGCVEFQYIRAYSIIFQRGIGRGDD